MTASQIGKISPFPPLPGQPYPPSRNHPRGKEISRLHDEWIMKYWPFSSEKKRARIPCMNLGGFGTWCAPAADFYRMVWCTRVMGILFLADDYMDGGKMHDRILGFKKAATGTGPLHAEDRAEICNDVVFRAIKATSHPRTFDQLTRYTHEFWDFRIPEPFRNLDQYLTAQRGIHGACFAYACLRYALDINLTDEQLNHPLMREAEGVITDNASLTNDLFSYMKEKMTDSDGRNIMRLLQVHERISYEQAKFRMEQKIRQKEQDFIPAGMAVLNDPILGEDPEVRRWIACLPYVMGGNTAWSQETGRYNVGKMPNGVPFPALSFQIEETPADEVIDDTEDSLLHCHIFDVAEAPPPEFTIDADPIEGGNVRTNTKSALPKFLSLAAAVRPRPEDVGILAMDIYIPHRCISPAEIEASNFGLQGKYTTGVAREYLACVEDGEDLCSIALSTVSALLKKYNVDPRTIGRIDVATETTTENYRSIKTVLMDLFKDSGNMDIEGTESMDGCYGSAMALFNSINWVESSSWDGRNAIVFAGDIARGVEGARRFAGGTCAVALLIGPNSPLVVEPTRGVFMDNIGNSQSGDLTTYEFPSRRAYLTALDESYSSYQRKRSQEYIERSPSGQRSNGIKCIDNAKHKYLEPITFLSEFDYMFYHSPDETTVRQAHSRVSYNDYLTNPNVPMYAGIPANMRNTSRAASLNDEVLGQAFMKVSKADYNRRVSPLLTVRERCGNPYAASLYAGLASLIDAVPGYDLFEKRLSMFAYGSGCASMFFAVRFKGDTKLIRDTMALRERLQAVQVTSIDEHVEATKLREKSEKSVSYPPIGSIRNLKAGSNYLASIGAHGQRNYGTA